MGIFFWVRLRNSCLDEEKFLTGMGLWMNQELLCCRGNNWWDPCHSGLKCLEKGGGGGLLLGSLSGEYASLLKCTSQSLSRLFFGHHYYYYYYYYYWDDVIIIIFNAPTSTPLMNATAVHRGFPIFAPFKSYHPTSTQNNSFLCIYFLFILFHSIQSFFFTLFSFVSLPIVS